MSKFNYYFNEEINIQKKKNRTSRQDAYVNVACKTIGLQNKTQPSIFLKKSSTTFINKNNLFSLTLYSLFTLTFAINIFSVYLSFNRYKSDTNFNLIKTSL